MEGIQYQIDDQGHKRAVVIDLERYGALWEDFYDVLLAEQRLQEPRETLKEVKAHLRAAGKLSDEAAHG